MNDDERVTYERRLATLEANHQAMTVALEALTVDHRKLIQYIVAAMIGSIIFLGTNIYQAMTAGRL